MTDVNDLYAAIVAAPHDLDLRLAYADAIAKSDRTHAELIRLQVGHTRNERVLLQTFDDRDIDADRALWRSQLLETRLRRRVGAPILDLEPRPGLLNGFAEHVQMTGTEFLAAAAELYRRAPIRHVTFQDTDAEQVAALAADPLTAPLVSISLGWNRIGDAGLLSLIASDHLRGLRWLDLDRCDITAEGAEAFAAAAPTQLPNLQWLGFAGNVPFLPYYEEPENEGDEWPFHVPELGARLNELHGPFPWMRSEWAYYGRPDRGAV